MSETLKSVEMEGTVAAFRHPDSKPKAFNLREAIDHYMSSMDPVGSDAPDGFMGQFFNAEREAEGMQALLAFDVKP